MEPPNAVNRRPAASIIICAARNEQALLRETLSRVCAPTVQDFEVILVDYKRKDELKTKKIVPDTTYDKIKDHVIAKQTAAAKNAKKDDTKK